MGGSSPASPHVCAPCRRLALLIQDHVPVTATTRQRHLPLTDCFLCSQSQAKHVPSQGCCEDAIRQRVYSTGQSKWSTVSVRLMVALGTLHTVPFQLCNDFINCLLSKSLGFPGGSDSKESACIVGDSGMIPGLGRSPGEGNCNPLQYSCLEIPHGQRRLAGYSPWHHKESDMTE